MANRGRHLKREEDCNCAFCQGVGDPDPDWGFDRNLIPQIRCTICREFIGKEPYIYEPSLARFGSMQFDHRRCLGEERCRLRERDMMLNAYGRGSQVEWKADLRRKGIIK